MYLIVGRPEDSFCQAIRARLRENDRNCLILGELFQVPGRAALTISGPAVLSQCEDSDDGWVYGNDLCGVYIRELVYPDPALWSPEDYDYVCQEITGAFLGWLAALSCLVLNRYNPRTWSMRFCSALAWRASARRCGLEIDDRWANQTKPISRRRLYRVAAVGEELVWDLLPPPDYKQLGTPLHLLMELNHLSTLEAVFNFEQGHSRLYSITLELSPQRFAFAQRQQILERMVALLLGRSTTKGEAK